MRFSTCLFYGEPSMLIEQSERSPLDSEHPNTVLFIAFPAHAEAIADLRLENEGFDEICRDFVAIAELISASNEDAPSEDMQACLAGLKQDIEEALAGAHAVTGNGMKDMKR